MLVNLIRLGVMEWTSPPQTDTIRCDAAVAAASHHPRHAVTLFSPRTTSPPSASASGGRSGTWPDEVSLQADDPLDDLLLGILGRSDGTKKNKNKKHMNTKPVKWRCDAVSHKRWEMCSFRCILRSEACDDPPESRHIFRLLQRSKTDQTEAACWTSGNQVGFCRNIKLLRRPRHGWWWDHPFNANINIWRSHFILKDSNSLIQHCGVVRSW